MYVGRGGGRRGVGRRERRGGLLFLCFVSVSCSPEPRPGPEGGAEDPHQRQGRQDSFLLALYEVADSMAYYACTTAQGGSQWRPGRRGLLFLLPAAAWASRRPAGQTRSRRGQRRLPAAPPAPARLHSRGVIGVCVQAGSSSSSSSSSRVWALLGTAARSERRRGRGRVVGFRLDYD
jgi:hypothetical protein